MRQGTNSRMGRRAELSGGAMVDAGGGPQLPTASAELRNKQQVPDRQSLKAPCAERPEPAGCHHKGWTAVLALLGFTTAALQICELTGKCYSDQTTAAAL